MTIEERILQIYGFTDDPMLSVWMLKDGTLVNGSHEGYNRDVDHHEISAYYKRSKFHEPGSSSLYVYKFMRRGNIRMGCSRSEFCMELCGTPTEEQLYQMIRIAKLAFKYHIGVSIGYSTKRKPKPTWLHFDEYLMYLSKYTKLQKEVDKILRSDDCFWLYKL